MEKKIKDLKTASKVISVITKIGYTAMIIMLCICAAMLIFIAATGGKVSSFSMGGTNIIIFDETAYTPAEITALCAVLLVMGGIFLAILLLASRMFHEISLTGMPFKEKYAKTIRVIGVLTALLPIAVGITEGIATVFVRSELPQIYKDAPGIVTGAIIFCLSFIIDYGCGLEKTPDTSFEEEAAK